MDMTQEGQRASAIYVGQVMHRRLRPMRHRFRYRVASLLLDLDEIDALSRDVALFARNRFGLASFHDRDHGPRDGSPLRSWIDGHLAAAGIDLAGGSVRLLAMPRVLGYGFNPLSVWFCHDPDGELRAVLYEVSNTFGERHSYLVPVTSAEARSGVLRHEVPKRFYVSPFIDLEGSYAFRLRPPGARYAISIEERDADGAVMVAAQTGERRPLTSRQLARTMLRFPFMPQKTMTAIHWEALRLWLKGARYRRRPLPPPLEVTAAGISSSPVSEVVG